MPSSATKLSENAPDKTEQDMEESSKGGLLGLPESDTDLDVRIMKFLLLSLCRALWRILRAKMENLAG